MKVLRPICSCVMLILCTGAMPAWALPNPSSPKVKVLGQTGAHKAAYWVVAEDAKGRTTNLSSLAIVSNLPATLDENNHVNITIQPVEGAVKYYVLKTFEMKAPDNVTVTAGKPGDKTFYYWIVTQSTWRLSAMAGPYVVKNCQSPKGNIIRWSPVPNSTNYQIFRTTQPQSPVGHNYWLAADFSNILPEFRKTLNSIHEYVDTDNPGWVAAGYPATAVSERPQGEALVLLATTTADQLTVIDHGQPLGKFRIPTANSTEQDAVSMPKSRHSDLRGRRSPRATMVDIQSKESLRAIRPSFGSGANTLSIKQTAISGGHSERPIMSGPMYRGKTNHHGIEVDQDLHVATQAMTIAGSQQNYGTGDSIVYHALQYYYGSNNDGGDEGVYPMRQSVDRKLNRYDMELSADAPRGSVRVHPKFLRTYQFGTERLLINFTQSHQAGRIQSVTNVEITGKNTQWTPDLAGRWISFDIENIKARDQKTYRMWHQVWKVNSPTSITIRAKVSWSDSVNLGYSRWIYDPQIQKKPTYGGSALAIRKLPKELRQASTEGKYIICSGTLLGDPWKVGDTLNVEPLDCDWKKGDKISLVAGPQAFIGGGRIMLFGDYLPQDLVEGLKIRNYGNRPTNGAAIVIGVPSHQNFADGVVINLPPNGYGNGLVINAGTGWDANGDMIGNGGVYQSAIVVPTGVPVLAPGRPTAYPYLTFTDNRKKNTPSSFDITTIDGPLVQFTRDNQVHFTVPVTFEDSVKFPEKMRGKSVFEGNGKRTKFKIMLSGRFATKPFVQMTTNQFIASRLARVGNSSFTVEFQEPPAAGRVEIYWMAVQ